MSGAAQQIVYSYAHVPTVKAFAKSDAFIRGLSGPFASGKSAGCVVEIVKRGIAQRPGPDGVARTRWAVIRQTYSELRMTTIKTVLDWFPPTMFGDFRENPTPQYIIRGFKGVEIEILFLALDRPEDVKKLLSLELTGAWVNEAREVPWGIIEVLQGRLGRFPAIRNGGPTWTGLIMDTNPPDADSKWYWFFEEADHSEAVEALAQFIPGITVDSYAAIFKQPSGLSADAENLPNLQPGYYQRLAIGKSPEWVNIYVKGQYGFVMEGLPVFPEFQDGVHMSANLKTDPTLPVIRGWDFGLCYSDDTEVLTRAGWKLFKDVHVAGDLIATRNPATGEMEYAQAAFKVAEPFQGEMLEWSSTELNMLVTPEHRVPFTHRDRPSDVRWESAQWLADNMGRHHLVDLCSSWSAPEFDENERWFGLAATEWAEFLAIYLAEGSVDGKRATIYQTKQDPEMQRILNATGWDWRRFDVPGKMGGWRVYHPAIASELSALGLSGRKRVPQCVREMPADIIQKFIMAYTLGDGHIRTRENRAVEHTVFTTSKMMAGDMQDLAQKAGWNSSVNWMKPVTSYITEGATVRAIVGNGGWSVTFKKHARRAELHRRNFRRITYDGLVYCLNVPHHTLYVRRKGKPHWNGNTPACVFSQATANGQLITVDEITSENMGIMRFAEFVLQHSKTAFRKREFIDVGDPAGMSRSQTDERSCFDIMRGMGIDIWPAPQTLQIRLESMRKPLNSMRGGRPGFLLHERCKTLRRAFLGGYHYKKMGKLDGEWQNLPNKNRFSHPMDAQTYIAAYLYGDSLTTLPDQRGRSDDELIFANNRSRDSTTGY